MGTVNSPFFVVEADGVLILHWFIKRLLGIITILICVVVDFIFCLGQ